MTIIIRAKGGEIKMDHNFASLDPLVQEHLWRIANTMRAAHVAIQEHNYGTAEELLGDALDGMPYDTGVTREWIVPVHLLT